ncbi:MAG: hypothetical protein ACYCRE_00180 [Acidobacteriaceae bacterium]
MAKMLEIDRDPPSIQVSDPKTILGQLENILGSPAFRNSKRYPRFLRFIVEQTLLGHADLLKERLLGIEIFDRPPDYDTATDPIVRVAAGEIRKRLAQYYVENIHEDELRIRLLPGTYVPEFCAPQTHTPSGLPAASHFPASSLRLMASPRLKAGVAAAVAVVGLVITLCLYWGTRPNPLDLFWMPFLRSANSPKICLGDITPLPTTLDTGEYPGLRTGVSSKDHLALADVKALNLVSGFLVQQKKQGGILNAESATFADFLRQPAILIGGSSNQWTMRSMQFLRFQIVRDFSPGVNGIRDRDNLSRLRWMVDFNAPYSSIKKEYAIVARFHDPTTDQPTMIVAGIGANGTIAAAEFLTTPAYVKDFVDHAPRNWESRNIEIVLETQMINGDSGPPRIVATDIW